MRASISTLLQLDLQRLTLERLVDMEASEIGAALRHPGMGGTVRALVDSFPHLSLEARLQPVTRCALPGLDTQLRRPRPTVRLRVPGACPQRDTAAYRLPSAGVLSVACHAGLCCGCS